MRTKLTDSQLRFFKTLREGQTVEGKVIKFSRHGVFIRHKVLTGLLHLNDITYGRITDAEDFLKLNQKLNVKIIKIDHQNNKLQFGLKQMQPHPWQGVNEKYHAGDTVVATVVDVKPYGAFLSIAPGIEGLLHVSQVPDLKDGEVAALEYFKTDEVYQVKIFHLDVENKKIAFTLIE